MDTIDSVLIILQDFIFSAICYDYVSIMSAKLLFRAFIKMNFFIKGKERQYLYSTKKAI